MSQCKKMNRYLFVRDEVQTGLVHLSCSLWVLTRKKERMKDKQIDKNK